MVHNDVKDALDRLRLFATKHYDLKNLEKIFYGDYRRRAELLTAISNNVPKGSTILDAGSSPGFTSLALKFMGYNVHSIDINPEPYSNILEAQGIKVYKVDLECDKIPLGDETVDCICFTEVLEHLSPYNIPYTLSELNRVLKVGGLLFLTSPNLASIGKRVKLLLGNQIIPDIHVREYTLKDVIKLLKECGFIISKAGYSMAYNLTPHDASGEDYCRDLLTAFLKYPTKENLFHIFTLPIVCLLYTSDAADE